MYIKSYCLNNGQVHLDCILRYHQDLFLRFTFHLVYVLHFAFSSIIHFELAFVNGIWYVSRFFRCSCCRCPAVPWPFVEKSTFTPLYCLFSFVKNHWIIFNVGPYLGSLFCSSVCLFVLPVLHCPDYGSSVTNFEIRNGSPLSLFFSRLFWAPCMSVSNLEPVCSFL